MAKKAKGTVVAENWRPLPKAIAYCMDELKMSQSDIEEQIKACIYWQRRDKYEYADHDAVFRNHCDRWRKKNPIRKESSEPLQSYVYAGRRHPEEIYPCPPSSPFKQKMRHGHSQSPKFAAWRAKALKAMPGTLSPHEAAEWIQEQMQRCSND